MYDAYFRFNNWNEISKFYEHSKCKYLNEKVSDTKEKNWSKAH